jgi:hypothetical protein
VGAATGFFSFEFERRGAEVVAFEVPSIESLDRFPGQTAPDVFANIVAMLSDSGVSTYDPPRTSEELFDRLLRAPFDFCHRVLRSRVVRRFGSVHELSQGTAGASSFDLVFLGDVLLHTIDPLSALAKAAALCSGTLIVAQAMPELDPDVPALLYVGGEGPSRDDFSWWVPTRSCLVQLLRKLGFAEVRDVGSHRGQVRPGGQAYDRRILHAIRT